MSTQAIRNQLGTAAVALLVAGMSAACLGAGTGPTGAIQTGPGTTPAATPAATALPSARATAVASPVKPTPTATAKSGKASVAGTVTWNATIARDATHGSAVTGTMHLVLDEDLRVFTTFYNRGTYAYDLEEFGCTPGTHQEGTFDSSSGSYEDLSIAQVVVISAGMRQDFEMSIFSLEHWTAKCDRLTLELNTHDAFPGCELGRPGRVPVVYDGVDSYRVSCDVTSYSGGPSVTGHIEGLLTPYFQ